MEIKKIKEFLGVSFMLDLLGSNIYNDISLILLDVIKNPHDNGEVLIEYISSFIASGGLSGYIFNVKIDSSFNIHIMNDIFFSFIKSMKKSDKEIFLNIKKNLKTTFKEISKHYSIYKNKNTENYDKTLQMISYIEEDEKYEGIANDNISSDICVIIMPIGFIHYKELDKMVEWTVKITKLTHNNTTSILSAIISSYFVSMAMNKIPIENWCNNIIGLVNSDNVKKYINLDVNQNMIEYSNFVKIWVDYISLRFNEKKVKKTRSDENLLFKLKFYEKYAQNKVGANFIGEDCISCLIVVYDSLLMCEDNFERLIYYGMLIPGNVISIGGLIGALWGIIYGMDNIPKNMFNINIKEFQKIMKMDE
jgi:ADP-ribosylglycohydrolase